MTLTVANFLDLFKVDWTRGKIVALALIVVFLLAVIGLLVYFFLYDMSHDNGLKPGAHLLGTVYR